jgi:hypothetical protein
VLPSRDSAAQLYHPLFRFRRGLPRTVQRPPTALCDRFDSAGPIALHPKPPGGTTNRIRCSRTPIVFQGIVSDTPALARAECKACRETHWKECHATEHDVGLSGPVCPPSAPPSASGLFAPGPSTAAGETSIPEYRLSRTGQGCSDNSAKSRP